MALKSLKCIDIPHFVIIILHSNDYNNHYSGAPAREARVGQSPILMEYGQTLFVWLSHD